jgi:phenylacetate 2-hydroxylase
LALQVFISSHTALAKTVVQQGPAFQSRPTFKLFHSDFASSGIWTVGTSPFSDRLVRTRKALSSQIAPRLLPIYTPVIHPKLKKLFGEILVISQGPPIDMAEKLHRFGTGQVSEQLMGVPLDDDMVGMLAENETNICKNPLMR